MNDEWDGFFSRDDEHETDAREQWDEGYLAWLEWLHRA